MKLATSKLAACIGCFVGLAILSAAFLPAATAEELNQPPEGFTALFNGEDLTGWKGLVGNPKTRAAMSPEELAKAQEAANERMRQHWTVEDGVIVFDGKGKSLCTAKDYGDFEMYVDWKIKPKGDSGIYLRGTPQVQIWDPNQHKIGSGGLYNNKKHPSKPLVTADNPIGEWNTFYIKMVGEKVTVKLNGKLVVDEVPLENYWERDKPIYPTGQIELQNHGNTLWFRNIYIKELDNKTSAKEREDARTFSQKALDVKGFGEIDPDTSVQIQIDEKDWYVSGQVRDNKMKNLPFEVHFQVTRFEDGETRRQTWSVKNVTVDEEVVYP